MNRLVTWNGVVFLTLLLAPGCAMFQGNSATKHPAVEALDWPEYDRSFLPGGGVEYSLPSETADNVTFGDTWSLGAAQQRNAFWQRVLRDRCVMREVLQIANGEKPQPDGICQPTKE